MEADVFTNRSIIFACNEKNVFTMKQSAQSLFLVLVMSLLMSGVNEAAADNDVEWLTMEEAQEKVEEEPKKVFVDIYTDWCGWCRRMSSQTYAHPVIADYLNNNFYPVKLNAEQEEPIEFRGTTYENNNLGDRRPTHDFAIALLQGQMSYPSIAFFDESLNLITAIPGFRPPHSMEAVLSFFGEDVFKEDSDLDAYMESFEGQIEPEE